jgi:hypothetical protein
MLQDGAHDVRNFLEAFLAANLSRPRGVFREFWDGRVSDADAVGIRAVPYRGTLRDCRL